jgi:phage-related protein
MTVKTVEQEVIVEMVEKSQFESIEKALKEQAVALEKALETVKQFEKEKAEAVQKSRKDLLTATVKDADKVEALFKGFANVESQEIFESAIKALEGMMTAQTNSDLFKELGASTQALKQDEDTPLMKAAKAAAAQAKSTK